MKQLTRQLIRSACTGAIILSVAPWLGAQTPNSTPPAAAEPAPISNEQASYLFGLTLGNQLHSVGLGNELTLDTIARGIKDGLQGKKSTPADMHQIQEYVHTAMLAASTHNKTAAQEFLASNGKKPGVKTTASGLEYKIDKAGDAKAPAITAEDEVTVNYRGTLLDGSEFDSSESHGKPLEIPVGGVIKGWQEALVMMKPGAKWTLYIPPELAYGANPRPGIPGNSLLTFNIEILSVKPKLAAPMPMPQKPGAAPQPR
ncbi:MAG TPA: FKBP-type peptidyl-prolyl cis-trans isomerase [Steroidobacteraceae bacterium]